MINRIIKNYLTSTIISLLKGKKRWLVILALAAVQLTQSAGYELTDLADGIANLINLQEG